MQQEEKNQRVSGLYKDGLESIAEKEGVSLEEAASIELGRLLDVNAEEQVEPMLESLEELEQEQAESE